MEMAKILFWGVVRGYRSYIFVRIDHPAGDRAFFFNKVS